MDDNEPSELVWVYAIPMGCFACSAVLIYLAFALN